VLVRRPVEVDHRLVYLGQGVPVTTAEQVGDLAVDIRHRLEHPAAPEPGLVVVAQFHRFQ